MSDSLINSILTGLPASVIWVFLAGFVIFLTKKEVKENTEVGALFLAREIFVYGFALLIAILVWGFLRPESAALLKNPAQFFSFSSLYTLGLSLGLLVGQPFFIWYFKQEQKYKKNFLVEWVERHKVIFGLLLLVLVLFVFYAVFKIPLPSLGDALLLIFLLFFVKHVYGIKIRANSIADWALVGQYLLFTVSVVLFFTQLLSLFLVGVF